MQRVISEFAGFYRERLEAWARDGRFPVNGQVEIRVGGLDQTSDVAAPGARPPLLSVVRPHPDHPEFDRAVWADAARHPRRGRVLPGAGTFLPGDLRRRAPLTRVEWSKGWGYTDIAAWADPEVIGTVVPRSYGEGQWAEGTELLRRLDPHGVFGNAFLDGLLGP